MKGYVRFELGLLDGKVDNVRSEAGDSRIDDAFRWQVTSKDGAVTIHGVDGGTLCQIGHAAISDEAVMDARVGRTDTEPNDYQWQLVAQGFSTVWGMQVRIAGDRRAAEMDDGGAARGRKRSAARSSPPAAPAPAWSSRIGVRHGVAAALFLGGLGLLIFVAVGKTHTAVPAPPPAATAAIAIAAPEPPPPPPPSLELQIATAPSLSRAIALAVPQLGDGADNEGAWMLARYGSARLTWNDAYVAEHETSFGLVLKDSDRERGKRMCATGKVRDIERQDLVGLFDLPENQRPTVER